MNKLSVLYLLVNLEVRFTDILVSILTNIQVNSHNCFMQSLIFLLSLIFSRQARRDFDELVGSCMHMLANEEQQHMEELRAYVVEDDGAWALGENFGDLFSRIFPGLQHSRAGEVPPRAHSCCGGVEGRCHPPAASGPQRPHHHELC